MKKDQGLIGYVLLIIIALALLKYFFNWSIFEAAATPQGQETVGYTHQVINTVWSHLGVPFHFLWDKMFAPFFNLFWNTLKDFIFFSQKTVVNK